MNSRNYLNSKILGFFVKTNGVFSKPLFSGLGHILCFHRVMPKLNIPRIYANSGMEISPEKLEWIINYFLDRHYEVISMDQLLDIYSGTRSQKKKFIVITFDDGYLDNYMFAYPLLKSKNLPFTIYVTTDYPDNKALMWWYFLENYILEHDQFRWEIQGKETEFITSTQEEKELLFLNLRKEFINSNDVQIKKILNNIMEINDETISEFVKSNALTWKQIEEMATNPLVTIAAHTLSHKALSKLSKEEAFDEIAESKKKIEEHIGKPVIHFAYPYGSKNEATEREFVLAVQAGFNTAVTLNQGNCFAKHKNNLMRLPRIPLGEKTDVELLNNISNGIRQFSFNGFKKIV